MSKEIIRLNVPINMEMNSQLDEHSEKMGVSKAGLVRFIIQDYFKQMDALEFLKDEKLRTLVSKLNEEINAAKIDE